MPPHPALDEATRLAKDARAVAASFGRYFWNSLCAQPISGEKNVNWLLVPYLPPAPFGFYARRPVCTEPAERLARLPPTTLICALPRTFHPPASHLITLIT
jgi:hypothetical protein